MHSLTALKSNITPTHQQFIVALGAIIVLGMMISFAAGILVGLSLL
jgi:hypothetical protein